MIKHYILIWCIALSLLLTSTLSLGFVYYGGGNGGWGVQRGGTTIYYAPGYYNPYFRMPYSYPRTVIYPRDNTINSCPLMPSYFDEVGNWVPPTRVCSHAPY